MNTIGSSILPVRRYGDLHNRISVNTAGAFLGKDLVKGSMPYSKQYDVNGVFTPYINLHFLAEARRQLAGTEEVGTSTFSPVEKQFWDHYIEYSNDVVKEGELLVALDALDTWFIAELTGTPHPGLIRSYEDHRWNKTLTAEQSYLDHEWFKYDTRDPEAKGIRWI